jgi:hypothetical protein
MTLYLKIGSLFLLPELQIFSLRKKSYYTISSQFFLIYLCQNLQKYCKKVNCVTSRVIYSYLHCFFSLSYNVHESLMSSIAQLATHEEKSHHHDDGQLDLQSRTLISTGKLDTPT